MVFQEDRSNSHRDTSRQTRSAVTRAPRELTPPRDSNILESPLASIRYSPPSNPTAHRHNRAQPNPLNHLRDHIAPGFSNFENFRIELCTRLRKFCLRIFILSQATPLPSHKNRNFPLQQHRQKIFFYPIEIARMHQRRHRMRRRPPYVVEPMVSAPRRKHKRGLFMATLSKPGFD